MSTRLAWILVALVAGAFAAALTMAARADDKPIVMKISLVTLDDALHLYARNYAEAVERDSSGRIKPEVYPASQLGSTSDRLKACNSVRSSARWWRRNF